MTSMLVYRWSCVCLGVHKTKFCMLETWITMLAACVHTSAQILKSSDDTKLIVRSLDLKFSKPIRAGFFSLKLFDNFESGEKLNCLQRNYNLLDYIYFQGKSLKDTSKSGSPPRLVVLADSLEEGKYTSAFILADGISVKCTSAEGIVGMALQLLYSYYIWDLSYPKQCQILGFLQEVVLKDTDSKFFKCTRFKQFEKLYELQLTKDNSLR